MIFSYLRRPLNVLFSKYHLFLSSEGNIKRYVLYYLWNFSVRTYIYRTVINMKFSEFFPLPGKSSKILDDVRTVRSDVFFALFATIGDILNLNLRWRWNFSISDSSFCRIRKLTHNFSIENSFCMLPTWHLSYRCHQKIFMYAKR